NQADGPVFKIQDDPRYTKIGKILSRIGLDELPQLINIVKGEMAFVGPRPLPLQEANQIPSRYHKRFSVLPGITSTWVVNGSHKLSFTEWMELDVLYVKNRSIFLDISISVKTIFLLFHSFFRLFKK
ncbi:MAG TPA: sugar transferase, partial [Candidatus Woesebacteria bacterium]|nr:sugar transferase [Candidatus Woesebacteria bacterium]